MTLFEERRKKHSKKNSRKQGPKGTPGEPKVIQEREKKAFTWKKNQWGNFSYGFYGTKWSCTYLGFSEVCLASKSDFTRSHFSYGFYGAKWPARGPKGYKRDPTRRNTSLIIKKIMKESLFIWFSRVQVDMHVSKGPRRFYEKSLFIWLLY